VAVVQRKGCVEWFIPVRFGTFRSETKRNENTQRTLVHTRQILERKKQEHSNDAPAKDLYAPTGHVKHESLAPCIGKDLTSAIAKSQALLVFKSSYEFTTAASATATVAVFEDLLVPDAIP
jgi:hypothetical protein